MTEETTIVMLGHVDHGKSTLIGRLLYDTGQALEDRIEFARQRSAAQGRDLEFAFLLDGLSEEQEQGITIDFTQTRLQIDNRTFIIADAPGHREFLKNMLSGASRADAAFLVIDATEGVQEQSRRHAYLLALLGVQQVSVVINKMDLAEWSKVLFYNICQQSKEILAACGLQPVSFIPASAYLGDNIVNKASGLPWYQGPTVLEQLITFHPLVVNRDKLRLPIQDVYRMGRSRLLAGQIVSGNIQEGQKIKFWPTAEETTVKKIHCWPKTELSTASPGENIAIELNDPLFAERGMTVTDCYNHPISSRCFTTRLVWLGRESLTPGQRYKLRLGFQETGGWISQVNRIVDIGNLQDIQLESIPSGFVCEGIITTDQPLVFDLFTAIPETGRFVMIDNCRIAGGGIILETIPYEKPSFSHTPLSEKTKTALFPGNSYISKPERQKFNQHASLIVWFTGLSGSGKTTLARHLEQRLFHEGIQSYVLDGDTIRSGLNQDLNFTAKDRRENIRRISEVAKLFMDAGFISITAFISPYRTDRRYARGLVNENEFIEIFVKASLDTCERRDVKGLYAQARQGIVRQFTGIDDNYEEPEQPDIVVDTELHSINQCTEQIYNYIIKRIK